MNAVTEMPSPLIFTDNAAKKVKELIEEEGSPDLKLRVFVSGGGCSGSLRPSPSTPPRYCCANRRRC